MKSSLLFIFAVLLNLTMASQFKCDDLFYNEDSLVVINDELYSGYCDVFNKKGKIESKSYYGYGLLDSVVFFDENGLIKTVEPYVKERKNGIVKTYYKTGVVRQAIGFKNDIYFGFWREYYKTGNIKYEAEFIENREMKNDSYYTWTKKGVKYLHTCITKDKVIRKGKLIFSSGYGICKKTKVKSDN